VGSGEKSESRGRLRLQAGAPLKTRRIEEGGETKNPARASERRKHGRQFRERIAPGADRGTMKR
jgi:hypothetical protein